MKFFHLVSSGFHKAHNGVMEIRFFLLKNLSIGGSSLHFLLETPGGKLQPQYVHLCFPQCSSTLGDHMDAAKNYLMLRFSFLFITNQENRMKRKSKSRKANRGIESGWMIQLDDQLENMSGWEQRGRPKWNVAGEALLGRGRRLCAGRKREREEFPWMV